MPARQDQTLQIFLIILIFVSIVLMVATYLGWKSSSEANQKAAGLAGQLEKQGADTRKLQDEMSEMREMMGFAREDNTNSIKDAFTSDMVGKEKGKGMGKGVVDAQKLGTEAPDFRKVVDAGGSYRKVLEAVYGELQATAGREASLNKQLEQRNNDVKQIQSESEAKVAQFDEAAKKAQTELADERNRFAEDRKQLETTKQDLQKTLEQQRANYEKQISDRDGVIKDRTAKLTKLQHDYQNLKEEVRDEPGNFEVSDGRVSSVNADGTVWINLGTADSLRRQVTFSVYDAGQHDAAKATKKASIEVTKLMGDHLAEAHITDEKPTNPVMRGDQIYSQVWHRGKKLHFALTGIIDIDGDGKSDLQLARDLIELNGGVVDAYVDDQGKLQGEITATTSYLVLGDYPKLATQVGLQEAWNNMNKEAQSLGVKKIPIQDFLNQMGYKPQDRSVTLGKGASAHDFPARAGPVRVLPPAANSRPRAPVRTPAATTTAAPTTAP